LGAALIVASATVLCNVTGQYQWKQGCNTI